MRVLLLHPPLMPAGEVVPPVGLCTLAGWLLSLGHQVRVLDLDLELRVRGSGSQGVGNTLLLRALDEFQPDVLGTTSMYSNSLQAERLIRSAKHRLGAMATVAGGAHFGALGAASLSRVPELDFVIEGEGETAFAALLEALEHGHSWKRLPSLVYRKKDEVQANPSGELLDLAQLPRMWMDLGDSIDLKRYPTTIPSDSARRIVYVEAGRGCPFACTFCATAPFWRRRYRVKRPETLVDEIRFLHEELGYDHFVLLHDLLTAKAKFMSDICDTLLEVRLPVKWMANSRTDLRLHGLLPKMKAAGCWKLFFGIETASPRLQAQIDKHLDINEVIASVSELAEHGIASTCSFLVGMPDETAEDASSTIRLGARLKLLGTETVQFHRLRLWPPARLSRAGLPVEFDLDSLRIEFPFSEVPEEDEIAVREAGDFFGGYFVPQSTTGTAPQLAQLEMFFHHAVALAPLTVAALAQFAGSELVHSFFNALATDGPLRRDLLDWESGRLEANFRAIRSLLTVLATRAPREPVQRRIARGLLDYEERRLLFTAGKQLPPPLLATGANWSAFPAQVDVPEAIRRLQVDADLTDDLLVETAVAMRRGCSGEYETYRIERSALPELLRPDGEIAQALSVADWVTTGLGPLA